MTDTLYQTAVGALERLGRAPIADGPGALTLVLEGTHGPYAARLRVDDERRALFLHVASPVRVDKPLRRYPVAELILRTGFGLPVGGIDLAFDTGELRYRVGVDLGEDGVLGDARLGRLLDGAVAVLDWVHPALAAVAVEAEDPYFAAKELGVEQPHD